MSAKTAPVFNRMRHLLNVWVRTREAPGRRAYLAKVSVQTAGDRTNQFDHVLTITCQGLLHGAVFEQRRNHRILRRQWLQLPVARRVGYRNALSIQAFT